jgi:tetratricopeptide (TPR) repeat protein
VIEGALRHARRLAADGDDTAARHAYLDALRFDPRHPVALTELGALAQSDGYMSAAREAFRQAVQCHPGYTVAQVGYGDLLCEAGDPAAARNHYQTALSLDPDLPRAHQGLARALTALGQDAGEHWHKGFAGHAVVPRRYRGAGIGTPLLLLVSALGGNVSARHWLDDRVYAVTAVYADFWDPAETLPPHALIVNAIGDADLCDAALANAERIVAKSTAPVINPPARVRTTGRTAIARHLGRIPGVIAPRISLLSHAHPGFPLLLRAPGYHTGQHFVRVETADDLAAAAASLPGRNPLAIEYLDARGPDGMARKYRVMFIDGTAYPLHLAISADWKVHYFSAAMAAEPPFRAEEAHFLRSMPAVLGHRAMEALSAIQATLCLDYGGIDFGLAPDGSLLLFEANATMVLIPPDPDPIWDYRRRPVGAAIEAAQRMLARRVENGPAP